MCMCVCIIDDMDDIWYYNYFKSFVVVGAGVIDGSFTKKPLENFTPDNGSLSTVDVTSPVPAHPEAQPSPIDVDEEVLFGKAPPAVLAGIKRVSGKKRPAVSEEVLSQQQLLTPVVTATTLSSSTSSAAPSTQKRVKKVNQQKTLSDRYPGLARFK